MLLVDLSLSEDMRWLSQFANGEFEIERGGQNSERVGGYWEFVDSAQRQRTLKEKHGIESPIDGSCREKLSSGKAPLSDFR